MSFDVNNRTARRGPGERQAWGKCEQRAGCSVLWTHGRACLPIEPQSGRLTCSSMIDGSREITRTDKGIGGAKNSLSSASVVDSNKNSLSRVHPMG